LKIEYATYEGFGFTGGWQTYPSEEGIAIKGGFEAEFILCVFGVDITFIVGLNVISSPVVGLIMNCYVTKMKNI
jgi:hypothetical protein